MENETCKNCRFWLEGVAVEGQHPDDVEGSCRRYPPTVLSLNLSFAPHALPDDWCGEFQPVANRPSNLEFAREIWKTARRYNKARAIEELTKILDARLG